MPKKGAITALPKCEPCNLNKHQLFGCLYKTYAEKLLDCALFYCGKKEKAEDVRQDVFLKVWVNLNQLRLKIKDWKNWNAYLFVLTRNRAVNLIVSDSSQERTIETYSSLKNWIVWLNPVEEKECESVFYEEVNQLPYQQKEIFVLKYYRFKPRMIAKELNLATRTVSNTLFTVRKNLSDRVNEQFEIDEARVKLANEVSV